MPTCENCGEHVTHDFARIFGDEDGVVHRCIHCGKKNAGQKDVLKRSEEEEDA